MSRRGENIYKRKDGRWEGRYVRGHDSNGKAQYGSVYARTYVEVKQKLTEKKDAILRQPPDTARCEGIIFKGILDDWLKSVRVSIKESTYAKYAHIIDSHICPALGKYPIHQISAQRIEAFVQQQLSDGRLDHHGGLSPKTVTDMTSIIKASIDYAQRNGVEIVCNLSGLSIKKHEKEMRVLSKEEQNIFVKVLLDEIDRYKFGVLLSLYTGIRIGELCALTWEDLCLRSATLKIRKTMQRIQDKGLGATAKTKIIITEPKSKCSVRDIPLPSFLVELAAQFESHPKAFILSGKRTEYVEPRTMQNRFKKYIRESGIANTNFHATRHTFATRCVELGFDVKTLSEILGHANVNITLNRYVHSSFELKSSNMSKLSLPV